MINVTLVEDDVEIINLTQYLLKQQQDITCIASFQSAEAYLEALPTLKTDVVLMDIGLPNQSGIDCIRVCRPNFPNIQYIMFTDHTDSKEVFEALSVGASGYVLKGGTPERLAEAIREIMAGGSPMSPQIARMVTTFFQEAEPLYPELDQLTTEERAVLLGLDEGKSYKEIANQKFVSENTIRSQVGSIYRKLQVHTRTAALNKLHRRTKKMENYFCKKKNYFKSLFSVNGH
jgi:DNA-binding NarL/FixJ family response regulator